MIRLLRRVAGSPGPRPSLGEDEIPRYPPFMRGLPVVSGERLVDTQADLIESIFQAASPDARDRGHYTRVIRAFAGHAHLLPASQAHHHRGAGGLLRHSLEVGLYALQLAQKTMAFSDAAPAKRREAEPRWLFTAFFAGLHHDAGKPCVDVRVFDERRRAIWNPLAADLASWAAQHGLDRYFIEWVDGRGRAHVPLASMVAFRLLDGDTLDWIARGGQELLVWLAETLADNPSPSNPLHSIVVRADQLSVERDLRGAGMSMAGYDIGLPVERMLQDIMRRLAREGVWLINCPGARLWKINGHVYLVWPAGGEELAEAIRRDRLPGMPRTADSLLDMMTERGLATARGDGTLWRIRPAVLADSLGASWLTAVRLSSDSLVSIAPLTDVDGVCIEGEAENRSRPVATATTETQAHVEAAGGAPSSPAAPGTAGQEASNEMKRSGPVWHVLSALAEDIACGARAGADILARMGERVLLRWPDAVQGYGMDAKTLLEMLSSDGLVAPDPLAPMRLLQDADFNGARAKAVCLAPEAAAAFLALMPAGSDAGARPGEGDSPAPQDEGEGGAATSPMDALVETLVASGAAQVEDGWAIAPKYRVMAALRAMGAARSADEFDRFVQRYAGTIVLKGKSVMLRLKEGS